MKKLGGRQSCGRRLRRRRQSDHVIAGRTRRSAVRVAHSRGETHDRHEELAPHFRYSAFKESDGVSFVHVAFVSAEKNPLDGIAAFKAFTAGIKERCEAP